MHRFSIFWQRNKICFVIQGGNKNKSITEIGAIYCFSLKSITMLWKNGKLTVNDVILCLSRAVKVEHFYLNDNNDGDWWSYL